MNKQHQLIISPIQYPGGLRIVECEVCRYAFAAEVNELGMLRQETKVPINEGDLDASHSLFQVPSGPLLEISISAEI